jgi:hypothetical protein
VRGEADNGALTRIFVPQGDETGEAVKLNEAVHSLSLVRVIKVIKY